MQSPIQSLNVPAFAGVSQMSVVPGNQIFHLMHRGRGKIKGISRITAGHSQISNVELGGPLNFLIDVEQLKVSNLLQPLGSTLRVPTGQLIEYDLRDKNLKSRQIVSPPPARNEISRLDDRIGTLIQPVTGHRGIQVNRRLHKYSLVLIQLSRYSAPGAAGAGILSREHLQARNGSS